MNYRIDQTDLFKSDFFGALQYIVTVLENPSAAQALIEEFDRAAQVAARFPRTFPIWNGNTSRERPYRAIRVKNYLAFYVVLDDTVEFRRFLYARADLPTQLIQ